MYYGLTRTSQVFEMVDDVVEALKGNNEDIKTTKELIVSTIGQETHLGTFKDKTKYKYGTGLSQIDSGIPFEDIIKRSSKYHEVIEKRFNIDLKAVKHRELELSPLLSIILCRLKYKLVPKKIPKDIDGQWKYYKKYYNSYLGKAKREEYIRNRSFSLKKYREWLEGGEV